MENEQTRSVENKTKQKTNANNKRYF